MEIVVCGHHNIPSVYILNMISKLGETVAVSLDLIKYNMMNDDDCIIDG